MLLEQTCLLIGFTIYTLIHTANTLVVLSLNIEDLKRLTGLAKPNAELLMRFLRESHKTGGYGRPLPRGRTFDQDDATPRSNVRTFKIPKVNEYGRTGLDIVYERPSQKLKPNFRGNRSYPKYSDLDKGTTPFTIPGEIFESMYAKELRVGEERPERRHSDPDVPNKYVPKKDYHEEQLIREMPNPTVGLPAFGHKTFFNAAAEPDAIHIRQVGNRVISAVASSGRRNGEDLSLRPMVPDGLGSPVSPGEVINRRSMMKLQDNVLESIPDPDPAGQGSDDGIRRRAVMDIQKDVLDIIADPKIYM